MKNEIISLVIFKAGTKTVAVSIITGNNNLCIPAWLFVVILHKFCV